MAKKNESNTEAFVKELLEIKKESFKNLNHTDLAHFKKFVWTNRILKVVAFSFIWMAPNPISVLCLALALTGDWMVAHHVLHGGYDKVPNMPKRYHSKIFASGWRRYIDWFDWIYPQAWIYEHNVAHHYNTNESGDPDNVKHFLEYYDEKNFGKVTRYLIILVFMLTWKFSYYALNTMKSYHTKDQYDPRATTETKFLMSYDRGIWRATILKSYLPYGTAHFVMLPFMFYPLGLEAVFFVFINRLLAEALTNIHTFLIIVPNHSGSDLVYPDKHFSNKEEYYISQLLTTCNYWTGGSCRDYLSGYLNYQIEHHFFPDLPMSKYIHIQPKVKALCEKYELPYIQESIFVRFKKLMLLLTGDKDALENKLLMTEERS